MNPQMFCFSFSKVNSVPSCSVISILNRENGSLFIHSSILLSINKYFFIDVYLSSEPGKISFGNPFIISHTVFTTTGTGISHFTITARTAVLSFFELAHFTEFGVLNILSDFFVGNIPAQIHLSFKLNNLPLSSSHTGQVPLYLMSHIHSYEQIQQGFHFTYPIAISTISGTLIFFFVLLFIRKGFLFIVNTPSCDALPTHHP